MNKLINAYIDDLNEKVSDFIDNTATSLIDALDEAATWAKNNLPEEKPKVDLSTVLGDAMAEFNKKFGDFNFSAKNETKTHVPKTPGIGNKVRLVAEGDSFVEGYHNLLCIIDSEGGTSWDGNNGMWWVTPLEERPTYGYSKFLWNKSDMVLA